MENRLTSYLEGGTQVRAFLYDGDGALRVLKDASGDEVRRYIRVPGGYGDG